MSDVHGKLGWASAVTMLVFGVATGVAVAAKRSWTFPFAALVFAGAASAFFVNVFSVAPDPSTSGRPPATSTGQK